MEQDPKQILISKIKNAIPYIVIFILSVILVRHIGGEAYRGWKEIVIKDWQDKEYQKTFQLGQQDVQNFIANQLQTQGFIKIKVKEGEFWIFQPTATTSE